MRLQKVKADEPQRAGAIDRILHLPLSQQFTRLSICFHICLAFAIFIGLTRVFPLLIELSDRAVDTIEHPVISNIIFAVTVVAALIVLLTLVFSVCLILPRKLFSTEPEQFLVKCFRLIWVIALPFRPVIFLAEKLGTLLAVVFGYDPKHDNENPTEEELREMVDVSEESGVIEEEEREMIHNIFDFDDKDVEEVMTHRTDIVGLDIKAKISDVVYHAINDGFSRIPVYENDIDNIKGIIYVKDLLCLVGCNSSEEFKLSDFMRDAIFVPTAKKCTDLLRIFKEQKAHMAVVVDDYGGTAGIVSMEDLLEAIVGNIQDEYDNEQEPVLKLDENTYMLDGTANLEDIEELFEIDFEADEEITTVAGLIMNTLGRIPEDGDTPDVTIGNILFTVILAKDNRIERVKAELLPKLQKIKTAEK